MIKNTMTIIPAEAKEIFRWHAYSVLQRQQKLLDGSIKAFDQVKRDDTVQVIALKDDKVILSNEIQPHVGRRVGLFGGHVEPGEDPLTAAKRELYEEAGFHSDRWEKLNTYSYKFGIDRNVHYYIARDCQQVSQPAREPGEQVELYPISYHEFIDFIYAELFEHIDLFPFIRIMIDRKKAHAFIKFLQGDDKA